MDSVEGFASVPCVYLIKSVCEWWLWEGRNAYRFTQMLVFLPVKYFYVFRY